MAEMTISETLAEWGAGLAEGDVPPAMAATVRNILVDVVGLCLAARQTDYVAATLKSGETGEHVVVGHMARLTAADAALTNGTAAHGEDFDDTFEGGPVHSGAVVVPAILAAAERHELSASRILLGLTAGIELMCRLGLTAPRAIHKAGFHPTAVLGTHAAAFGVAVARGLPPRAIRDTLGVAGSMASGIIEYLGDGSWTKRMHAGWSAQAGIRAAGFGEAGFVGPAAVFEGEHGFFKAFAPTIEPLYDKLLGGLGQHWYGEAITFKPYPCGTMMQPYIDCAGRLRDEGLDLDQIDHIVCSTSDGFVHRLWEPADLKAKPPTSYASKFSVPFGVALGLVRGHAGLADFSDEAIADKAVLRVAEKVGYIVDPDDPYPARFTGHVRVTLKDGSVREVRQGHMRGGSEEPLSRSEIEAKFRDNARYGGIADPEGHLAACDAILTEPGAWRRIADLAA